MWLKRILICSVTFTGGYYVCFWPKNAGIRWYRRYEEKPTGHEEFSSYIYLPENAGIEFEEYIDSNWSFWKKNNMPMYWKLLMLSKSKDQKVRHKAVESLSKMSPLEKWQYMVIAQACDMQTSIGLARNFAASPYFFLPPPFKDLSKGNLQSELFTLLSSLSSDTDICNQNLMKQVMTSAKSLLKNGYSFELEIGDPLVLYHSQQRKKEAYFFHKLCLQAILSYSASSSNQNSMIKMGVLKLLLKVMLSHKKDPEMHSLLAQIIANFSLEEKFAKDIYMSGWIGILANWAKSPDIRVKLPAAKALANLDRDDIFHSLYDDGIYVLNPTFRQSSQNELVADVIFVHGLLGATFWTWRQCDTQKKIADSESNHANGEKASNSVNSNTDYTMCWPKDWLAADMPSLRLISVDYKTCISNWSSKCLQDKEKVNINKRAKEIINKLLLSNVGERPIIWIAHSLGGLIVKQILLEATESKEKKVQLLAEKTSGLILYSVPHKGSEVANRINSASHILLPSSDILQLKTESPTLLLLHENFKNMVLKHDVPVLSFGETKKSHWGITSSVLVTPDSANPGVGEFHTLPVDHLSTCKPKSCHSPEYLMVLNFLQENLSKTIEHETYSVKLPKQIFEISKILCLIP